VAVGSTQLSLRLDLDSSLGGVLQGVLVLFVIIGGAWQVRHARRRRTAAEAAATDAELTEDAPAAAAELVEET
jgi:hypothetical protein